MARLPWLLGLLLLLEGLLQLLVLWTMASSSSRGCRRCRLV
jgi:hypothetical protein